MHNENAVELAARAQELFESGDFENALKNINMAISMLPKNIDLHNLKSNILINKEDFPEALKELKLLETLDPGKASYYSMESICYLNMGNNEKALELADKAIKTDPEYIDSYYNHALALKNLGKINEAIIAYKIAGVKNPSDPDVHRDLGEIYINKKEYKMAERELKLAMRFRNDDKDIYNLMAELKLETDDIQGYYQTLLNAFNNTGNINYLIKITDFLIGSGDINNAERSAIDFYNIDKNNIDLVSNLAKVYSIENKYDDIDKIFEELIKNNDKIEANIAYIDILESTGQYDHALSIIDENIKKYPDENVFSFYKFYILSKKGEHEKALSIIKKLYENEPDMVQYSTSYAIELSYNNINDVAIKILNKISGIHSIDVETAYCMVYTNEGLYDKVIEHLKKLAEMEGNIEDIADIINSLMDVLVEKYCCDKLIKLLDELSNTENNFKRILYNVEKACVISIDNPDKALKILENIKSKRNVCFIINRYIKFKNEKILKFIENYYNNDCNDHLYTQTY